MSEPMHYDDVSVQWDRTYGAFYLVARQEFARSLSVMKVLLTRENKGRLLPSVRR